MILKSLLTYKSLLRLAIPSGRSLSSYDSFPLRSGYFPEQTEGSLFVGSFPVEDVRPATTQALSSNLQVLFSIEDKHELYLFLRRFPCSLRFYEELANFAQISEVSLANLLKMLDFYSWNSFMKGFEVLEHCTKSRYPVEYSENAYLHPHKTVCGSSSDPLAALKTLLDKATANLWPREVVLTQIELLLNKTILCGSQSTVDKVNKFIVNYNDPELTAPLLCITWLSFYLSPHEKDQRLAGDMLLNKETAMTPELDQTLSRIAEHLLVGRQLNRYYVLLQHFSKWTHKKKTKRLVERLFRHFYNTNNLRGCHSCVALARQLDLKLSEEIMFKYSFVKAPHHFMAHHRAPVYVF